MRSHGLSRRSSSNRVTPLAGQVKRRLAIDGYCFLAFRGGRHASISSIDWERPWGIARATSQLSAASGGVISPASLSRLTLLRFAPSTAASIYSTRTTARSALSSLVSGLALQKRASQRPTISSALHGSDATCSRSGLSTLNPGDGLCSRHLFRMALMVRAHGHSVSHQPEAIASGCITYLAARALISK